MGTTVGGTERAILDDVSRRVLEVVLAMVLGAAIVAIAMTLIAQRSSDDAAHEGNAAATTTTGVETTAKPADIDAFLDVWVASQEVDVLVVGRQQTIAVVAGTGVDPLTTNGEVTGSIDVRRARLGEREIEQVGTSALVTDATGQRSCDRIGGDYLCTAPTETPTIGERLVEFTERLTGPDAPYELFDDGDGCWRAVAIEPSPTLRWGQVSVWCFDAETGALDRTAVWRGDDRVQRFEASEISVDVMASDLDPA